MSTEPMKTDRGEAAVPWAGLPVAAAILAASLNLSIIAPIGSGLRLAASDAVAPLLALAMVWSARQTWRRLVPPPPIVIAAGMMTAVIAIGIAHGFVRIGEVFAWSFLNRGAGWLVLLGYAGIGFWLGRSGGRAVRWFFASFVLTCTVIGAAAISAHAAGNILWPDYNLTFGWIRLAEDIARADTGPLFDLAARQYFRLEGLSQNPNAFGLLAATAAIVLCADRERTIPLRWALVVLIVLLSAIYLSGSRSTWIGLAAAICVLLYVNGLPWRLLAPAALVTGIVVLGIPLLHELVTLVLRDLGVDLAETGMPPGTRAHPSEVMYHTSKHSLSHRWALIQAGLEMWRSNPVFGAGIGSFYYQQILGGEAYPSILHSTGLWLLAETGSAGLLATVVAFGWILWVFMASLRRSEPPERLSLLIATAVVICFAAASIGMDSLYQRALWLFLGIGSGCILNRAKDRAESAAAKPVT